MRLLQWNYYTIPMPIFIDNIKGLIIDKNKQGIMT